MEAGNRELGRLGDLPQCAKGSPPIYPFGVLPAVVPRLSRSSGVKPRLLLVDDHRGVLDRVSTLLSSDFDVVGVATDGRQALTRAIDLDPDVIVLDINMPEYHGFRTMRALEQIKSRAPVVFLSMMDTPEEISEAFRCGGRGFVVKTRMANDLASAIDQVLAGRLFAPALPSMLGLAEGGGHATQLYGDSITCLDGLEAFFDMALRRGDATCLIAPADLREGLALRLQGRGWNVTGAEGHGRYLEIDTADALTRVMRDGLPDRCVLTEMVAELEDYRRAEAAPRVTIWGNMAGFLIADGNLEGALAMERRWHDATDGLQIYTVCGYPASCFNGRHPDLWSASCAVHSAVCHASSLRARRPLM